MSHQHSAQATAVDIDAYNSTAVRLPEGALHELFAAQAVRTPDAVALVCGDRELSYRELDTAAAVLAHRLLARGVRPGDSVGLFQDRSLAYVVAVLAVLKTGGAYIPSTRVSPRSGGRSSSPTPAPSSSSPTVTSRPPPSRAPCPSCASPTTSSRRRSRPHP